MFITAQLDLPLGEGVKHVKQETDTHWRAPDGNGNFNYRLKFDVELDVDRLRKMRERFKSKNPNFTLKAWDRDILTLSSEFIGHHQRNMHDMFAVAFQRLQKFKKLEERIKSTVPEELRKEIFDQIETLPEKRQKAARTMLEGKTLTSRELFALQNDLIPGRQQEVFDLPSTLVRWPNKKQFDQLGNRSREEKSAAAPKDAAQPSNSFLGLFSRAEDATKNFNKSLLTSEEDTTPKGSLVFCGLDTLAGQQNSNGSDNDAAKAGRGKTPELMVSIEIMPKALADQRKNGHGRSEPNIYPVRT